MKNLPIKRELNASSHRICNPMLCETGFVISAAGAAGVVPNGLVLLCFGLQIRNNETY